MTPSFARSVIPAPLRERAKRFACDRGATAVEFALIAPMMLLTIIFIVFVGLGLYLNQELDRATVQAARSILTGSAQSSSMTREGLTNKICSYLPAPMKCADLIVNLYIVPKAMGPSGYYTYTNSDMTGLTVPSLTPGSGQFNLGIQGDYQYLQVVYPVFTLPSFMASMFGGYQYKGSPVYLAMSTAAFRNEKY